MANKKINQLTEILIPDNNDLLIVDDVSAGETKKITFQNLSERITTSLSQSIIASYAINAGNALTASYVLNAVSASFATSSTSALTASYVLNAVSASFATNALTASYAANADLLDNLDSTAFARLSVGNTFSANQVITGSVTATAGFSGSLTKLADGTSYIIAGNGIGVSSASNGSITISATGGGGTPGGTNTQIQYNNNGSFGGVTNLTWNGTILNATGSFKGNLDGTSSYATNAATASYVQNAVSASYATVAVSLTTSVFNVALNGSAPGVSTNIGGIYIPASTTVTTKSLAYIGGSTVSEVAVLKMVPINSVTVSASWVVTGTLTSVSLSNPVTLGPGWYDLTLETGTTSQTAFGRGLYLTSGDI